MSAEIIPFPIERRPSILIETGIVQASSDGEGVGERRYWLTASGGEFDGLIVHDDCTHAGALRAGALWAEHGYRLRDLTEGA